MLPGFSVDLRDLTRVGLEILLLNGFHVLLARVIRAAPKLIFLF